VREGLCEVAITVCPPACAMRVSERPKPEEQPVISHVSYFLGVVNVADMVAGLGLVKICEFEGNQFGEVSEVSEATSLMRKNPYSIYVAGRLVFYWLFMEIETVLRY
jgi:hypothetical protein